MSEKTTPPPGRPGYVRKLVHELKSPLSAIAAAAEVMRDEQLGPIGDERYLAYATDIHNSATHLLELVDRLLAQRSDGGVPAMSFTDLDVEELIAGIASQMLPLAKRAGVKGDGYEGYQRELIENRNRRMRTKSLPLLINGNAFIAVGALHLIGPSGLVALYREAGYTVTPVE